LLEVFQDFEVRGARPKLTTFLSHLFRALPDGWSRDIGQEKRLKPQFQNARQFVIQIAFKNERPAANLFLIVQESTLKVTNVVPREPGKLTRAQYNSLVEEFAQSARPIANRLGLHTHITSNQTDIRVLLTPETFSALRAFSAMANKSTGSSHPMDRERWLRFLVLEHSGGARLDGEILRRWLIEEERWPENEAYDLESEFAFARDLLRAYDAERS
jgi:hypothetical protein